jgi:hypothetical protein
VAHDRFTYPAMGHPQVYGTSGRAASRNSSVRPHRVPALLPQPVEVLPPIDVAWTAIELPPDLPMPSFTSTDVWNDKRVGALAVYCSDGRWGEAFDEFCHRGLSIPRYDRFAVPGGPAWFAHDDEDHPDLFKAAHDQIEFLVRSHALDRVVLFTHWGCAFYRERNDGKGARDCWPEQLDDVRTAATTLGLWFPAVRVESYLAMRIGSQMTFHRLDPAPVRKMTVPAAARR